MPAGISRLDQDEALAQLVVEQYLAGATLHSLACEHKVSWSCLRRTLIAHGVTIRPCIPPVHRRDPDAPPPERRPARALSQEQIAKLRAAIGYRPDWAYANDDSP